MVIKRKERKYFIVEGTSAFAIDMLRYDHAWPVSETKDSPNVAMQWDIGSEQYLKLRRIMLASDSETAPNHNRWRSFGWRVIAAANDEYQIEKYRNPETPSMFR